MSVISEDDWMVTLPEIRWQGLVAEQAFARRERLASLADQSIKLLSGLGVAVLLFAAKGNANTASWQFSAFVITTISGLHTWSNVALKAAEYRTGRTVNAEIAGASLRLRREWSSLAVGERHRKRRDINTLHEVMRRAGFREFPFSKREIDRAVNIVRARTLHTQEPKNYERK